MPQQITIRGRPFDVAMPPLDLREDLVYSYGQKWRSNRSGMPLVRVCAAMVALCIPEVAFGARGVSANVRDDLFAYGAEVYLSLREKGWTAADLISAGAALIVLLMAETFPRKSEVAAAVGNSDGGASA